eukprot:1662205-Prymnesium_polylepis.1
MLMRGCGAWAVGLCDSIRLGEGRSRPGLRVLRETATRLDSTLLTARRQRTGTITGEDRVQQQVKLRFKLRCRET